MEPSSDRDLPVGITFSGQRQAADEIQHQARVLALAINEEVEVKRARLQALGIDAAIAVMEARTKSLRDHGDKISALQKVCFDAMDGKTEELEALYAQEPEKAPDRRSRITMRYAQTAKILEELRNLQSTHPALDQKATFIGKVDARQVSMTPEQARERLAKFKTVDTE